MLTQPAVRVDDRQQTNKLPRSLGALETWGFGLSGLLLWLGTAPGMQAELGANAIWVWLPGIIGGILLNLQVQRLGKHLLDTAGGTPNYAAHLLKRHPKLARYGAIGYWLGWVSVPTVNAIVLTDFIKANLEPLGIDCPDTLLKIVFTSLPFVVALSGTRTLGILHLFFVIPAIGFLLAFCFQGILWLSLSPASPGFLPAVWPDLSFVGWAKWYFIAVYAVYGCETASSFVADSRRPDLTLRCLTFAASLIPVVYLGGSWVLLRLGNNSSFGANTFLNLVTASSPFWGQSASYLVTFLIASGCLLSSATAASLSPRILYQLAQNGNISPVFAVFSPRAVLVPALLFTLLASLLCLIWNDVTRVVMITGTGYLLSMMIVHLALWLRRKSSLVFGAWWALGFLLVEIVVLIVGGLAWSWQYFLLGLVLPLVILLVDKALRKIAFPPFHAAWWLNRYNSPSLHKVQDFVLLQVVVVILLVCGAASMGWAVRDWLNNGWNSDTFNSNLFVLLLLTVAFVAVAIACWTILPQVADIAEAKEIAENLFITALDTVPDTILVVDKTGAIVQANPAAVKLFQMNTSDPIGHRLNEFLADLVGNPSNWKPRSEQTLKQSGKRLRILDATISHTSNRNLTEYIVILRDITYRVESEATLKRQAAQLEQTLQDLKQTQAKLIQTEKMSSLGQLVAGVAHEINNPINFIYGNLLHVRRYATDLFSLLDLYEESDSYAKSKIQNLIAEIELDFIREDLPLTLDSMKFGVERIREIVLSLRNFSRLDEAEMKLVDIHEGIDSTLLILQNRLLDKSNYFDIEVIKKYGDLPPVECYAGDLNQVIFNILNNAIDALQINNSTKAIADIKNNRSQIKISSKLLDSDWVSISIKDNGPGIPDSVQSRIFDFFFTTKPVGKGTGLGLSISYQIVVDKHGGRLYCISPADRGCEFVIEIPIRQSDRG